MKLKDFYKAVVEEGIKHDPRAAKGARSYLDKVKKEYDALPARQKKYFDKEKLVNPFSDTRILYGNPDTEIRNIIAGIDMEMPEILLADNLKSKGKAIDLVLAHHPEGFARFIFFEVMNVQLDILKKAGVSGAKIDKLLWERMQEVMRKVLPSNAMRPVDCARLLDIPYMCSHTVADNFASEFINNLVEKNKPKTISDIIDLLMEEPEYKDSASNNAAPKLIHGKLTNRCGKIMIEMTGGTEGSKSIFPSLAKAGIKTIIGMHMSEEHLKKAKKYSFNILIAGHISSDNVGMNLLLDAVDKNSSLNIIEASGFRRFRRNGK